MTDQAAGAARVGPVSRAIGERQPFGPVERLDYDRLLAEQDVPSVARDGRRP